MTDSGKEPWTISSMNELLALARALEQEAIAGYIALAERMRREDQPKLAAVFDRLIAEEEGHLGNVDRWIGQLDVALPSVIRAKDAMFDDEGALLVAPELLNAYRAFSMAVRNEERAFVFWTYVAAQAPTQEIRKAAEQMAREELGHVATLRRERRRAFHDLRRTELEKSPPADPAALEARFASLLERQAQAAVQEHAARLRAHAGQAERRKASLEAFPVDRTSALDNVPEDIGNRLVPLCEFLLDFYLDLAERGKDEEQRARAQTFAGELIAALNAARTST